MAEIPQVAPRPCWGFVYYTGGSSELASDKVHRDGTPSAIQHRESRSVKPVPFAYHRLETLAEALRLLAELAPQDGR
jgi:hypothetical protein